MDPNKYFKQLPKDNIFSVMILIWTYTTLKKLYLGQQTSELDILYTVPWCQYGCSGTLSNLTAIYS